MEDSTETRLDREVTLEVVSYDPLRRLGFLRIADPAESERVHFSIGMLPETFKAPIVAASRPLNRSRDMTDEEFKQTMGAIRREVVGSRFRAVIAVRGDGRLRLRKRTIVHLADEVPPVTGSPTG